MIKLELIRKKGKFDKEKVPVWSDNTLNVEMIETSQGTNSFIMYQEDKNHYYATRF